MTRKNALPVAMEARRNRKAGYEVWDHVVEIVGDMSRWTVSLDGMLLEGRFDTSADAWAAGVAAADRMDHRIAT